MRHHQDRPEPILRRQVEIPASCDRSTAPLWLSLLIMSAIAALATLGWATAYIDKQRAELRSLDSDIDRLEHEVSIINAASMATELELALYMRACSLVFDTAPPELVDR